MKTKSCDCFISLFSFRCLKSTIVKKSGIISPSAVKTTTITSSKDSITINHPCEVNNEITPINKIKKRPLSPPVDGKTPAPYPKTNGKNIRSSPRGFKRKSLSPSESIPEKK